MSIRKLIEVENEAIKKETEAINPPTMHTARHPYLLVSPLATGPVRRYVPTNSEPMRVVFPTPAPNSLRNSGKKTPNVKEIPSTKTWLRKEAKTMTQPYLKRQNTTIHEGQLY